jgi:hypothetical protein
MRYFLQEHPIEFRGYTRTSFTFGSVIYELSARPAAWVTAGSPDASEYRNFPLY